MQSFADKPTPFGFNGLGELVYLRTYSRTKPDGAKERWHETVARVVNGAYTMQRQWVQGMRAGSGGGGGDGGRLTPRGTGSELGWKPLKAQRSAKEMFERIFHLKFSPPGRGLWAMGSPLTEERRLYAALNNCAFVSTKELAKDPAKPFMFLMDASMLGIGVGFDTAGAGSVVVLQPSSDGDAAAVHVVEDSREGWVAATRALIESYFVPGAAALTFNYSGVRPAGKPISGFGGVSSGPETLQRMHEAVRATLQRDAGKPISVTAIADIMNHIGVCVVAGNVRRSAEIAFGEPDDDEYVDLKNYERNPQRAAHGWASNNSVFARLGMDYGDVCERVRQNGEPGFAWLGMTAAKPPASRGAAAHPTWRRSRPPSLAALTPSLRCALSRRREHARLRQDERRARRARPARHGRQPVPGADAGAVRDVLPRGDVPDAPRLQGGLPAHAQVRLPLRQDRDAGCGCSGRARCATLTTAATQPHPSHTQDARTGRRRTASCCATGALAAR